MKKLSYSSTGHDDKQSHKNEKPSLIPISWAILVMGLSLAAITISYLWIGHIGSTYSAQTLQRQQRVPKKTIWLSTRTHHYKPKYTTNSTFSEKCVK